jgi:hypothetical protein
MLFYQSIYLSFNRRFICPLFIYYFTCSIIWSFIRRFIQGPFNKYRDWFLKKIKMYCRYHYNYLIIFKIHSSCIDTLSSARLPLVKSPLEVGFRNTVESLCRRRLNRLDGVEPMSFKLPFHSRSLKLCQGPKLFFTLATWASVRLVVGRLRRAHGLP